MHASPRDPLILEAPADDENDPSPGKLEKKTTSTPGSSC